LIILVARELYIMDLIKMKEIGKKKVSENKRKEEK